jgi:tRNA-2-methylthio-N6-dimethylallyladenosine synthase
MDGQVPEEEKRDRLERLQAVLEEGHAQYNRACVGRSLPVLFEKAGRRGGQLVGRSPYLQLVYADAGPERVGEIVSVDIQAAGANSLSGVIQGQS